MIVGYLDPTAGSMLIQTLIAAALVIPFTLRSRIARGVERVRGSGPRQGADQQPGDD